MKNESIHHRRGAPRKRPCGALSSASPGTSKARRFAPSGCGSVPGGDHAPAVAGGLGSCTMRQQRISAQPPPAASSHGETPNHSAMVGSRGAASPPRGGTAGCSTESGNNEQHRIPQIRVATAGDSAHAAGRNPTQSQPDIDSRERHAIRERLRARRGASCIAELRRHLITPFIERSGPLGHSWLRLHPMIDLDMGHTPVVTPTTTQPQVLAAAATRIREVIEDRHYSSTRSAQAAKRARDRRRTSPGHSPLHSASHVPYLVVTAAECMIECSPALRWLTWQRLSRSDPGSESTPSTEGAEGGLPPPQGERGPSGSTVTFEDVTAAFPVISRLLELGRQGRGRVAAVTHSGNGAVEDGLWVLSRHFAEEPFGARCQAQACWRFLIMHTRQGPETATLPQE